MEDFAINKIQSFARGLGFHLVNVIQPFSLSEEKHRFNEWLSKGYEADLEYMRKNTARRTDFNTLLPGVKSIICLAMNYYQPFPRAPLYSHAKVARYAWGSDYHNVISRKLKKIRKYIIEESGGELKKNDFKLCVDAAPILERACAVKAGFGFIGKNGMLITKQYGSWVFLAEILVRAKLEYGDECDGCGGGVGGCDGGVGGDECGGCGGGVGASARGLSCGSCSKCIKACPAGAIVEPRLIDAVKCNSYQTIENKKKIPPDARKNLKGWCFGCDICQEVCPHNSRFKITDIDEFKNHKSGPYLNKTKMAQMSEKQFDSEFSGSPLKRAGLKKLKDTMNCDRMKT